MLDTLLDKLPNFIVTDTEDKLKTYITNYVKNNVNNTTLNLFEKIILLEYADFLKIDSLTKSGDDYTMTKENIKEFIKKGIESDFEITDQDTYEEAIELNYKNLLKCSSDSTNDLCIKMKTELFPDVLNKPTTTQGPTSTQAAGSGTNTTQAAGSGTNTTQAAGSGTNTTQDAGSGTNATQAAGTNATQAAGTNTTQAAGSGTNTTSCW